MPISRNQQNRKKPNRRPLTKDGDKDKEDKVDVKLDAARKARAEEHKDKGNEAFKKADWLAALGHFSEAIAEDPSDHVFFSNRSAANLKLLRTADAVEDAQQCVRLAPEWAKGFFAPRRGSLGRPTAQGSRGCVRQRFGAGAWQRVDGHEPCRGAGRAGEREGGSSGGRGGGR
jgi:tetratricopeptide (TPR) repeat protein